MQARQALTAARAARGALSGSYSLLLSGKHNAPRPNVSSPGCPHPEVPRLEEPRTRPLTSCAGLSTGTPQVHHSGESPTAPLFFPKGAPGAWRGLSTHVGHGSGGREKGPELHTPPETHPFAVRGLNHIALAVPDVAGAAEHYRTVFGAQVSDPHELVEHGVKVVYVHVGATTLELLQPLGTGSTGSPIAKFLERNPRGGVHHLCFTVDNIEVASQHVAEEGVKVLGNFGSLPRDAPQGPAGVPAPSTGTHGNPVLFLDPRDNLGVLCELEQVFCHER